MSLLATDLNVTLSGRPVLHGVSLCGRAGQLTAIIGPIGSGKTTGLGGGTRPGQARRSLRNAAEAPQPAITATASDISP